MMKKLLLAAFTLLSLPAFAQQKTLIIDAAHGAEDTGPIGATGISESYINYLFAEALKKEALAAGFQVVLTHTDNTTNPSLDERAALISKYPGNNTYFVSIHANASADESKTGMELIVDPASGVKNGSKVWAEKISALLAPKAGSATVLSKKLQVLANSSVPAIAIELGYVTNLNDLRKLETIPYREEFAKLLVSTLL